MSVNFGHNADQYAIHFSGYCYLLGFLPIPFVSLQLPTWLVPTLTSGDVEDIMESTLPRDSEFFGGSVCLEEDANNIDGDNYGTASTNGNNKVDANRHNMTDAPVSNISGVSGATVSNRITATSEGHQRNSTLRRRSMVLKNAAVANPNADQPRTPQNTQHGDFNDNSNNHESKQGINQNSKKRKHKTRGSLLEKVDIHRIPLQQVFETIFQFGKSFDVKCDGQVSFPRMDLSFSLPDKSRSKVQIDAMRQQKPCHLEAGVRGGYCDVEDESSIQKDTSGSKVNRAHIEKTNSETSGKASASTDDSSSTRLPRSSISKPDFSRVFLCFDNLTIDGQTLVKAEGNDADADTAKHDGGFRKNVFILQNHLRPIWDCSAEILSWLVYNSIEKKSVDVLDRLLKRTEDAGEKILGNEGKFMDAK
jgi:hypothetical protein